MNRINICHSIGFTSLYGYKMPTENAYKSTLLLDLDETTFIALLESEFDLHGSTDESIKRYKGIHPSHTLSKSLKNSGFYFFVLNPEKLKKMIEAIYEAGDNIVIFTSGLWLKPVLSIVSQLCCLSDDICRRFIQSLFLNPQHDSEKLSCPLYDTRTLLKGYRLHGLFRPVPELRGRHFVLLDNDSGHIASCETCTYLDGVQATTAAEDICFYDTALEKMQLGHTEGTRLSPPSGTYYYPEKILKAFITIAMNQSQPEKVLSCS